MKIAIEMNDIIFEAMEYYVDLKYHSNVFPFYKFEQRQIVYEHQAQQ